MQWKGASLYAETTSLIELEMFELSFNVNILKFNLFSSAILCACFRDCEERGKTHTFQCKGSVDKSRSKDERQTFEGKHVIL